SQIQPPPPYATRPPSGETTGVVSSQYGAGSRPAVRRLTPPSSRSSSQTSEVSRSWMKATARPSLPIEIDRGRSVAAIASSRQCGGLGSPRRVGVGTPPYSSLPIQTDSGSGMQPLLDSLERREHEPADRREIVAALLHDDGRQTEVAEEAAAFTKAVAADLERALRVDGCRVDAERDNEGVRTGSTSSRTPHAGRGDPAGACTRRRPPHPRARGRRPSARSRPRHARHARSRVRQASWCRTRRSPSAPPARPG